MGWDSMAGVGFDGIGAEMVTLLLAAGLVAADEGKVVKISANGEAGLCVAEDNFYGAINKVDLGTNVAAVQRKGFITVAYTGAPGINYVELVANGAGGVKPPAVAGTGRKYFVVSKDATAGTLTIDLG